MASLRRHQRTGGLTLPEVIMAMGLLTVVVLLVMGVFLGGLKLMTRSEQRTRASDMGGLLLATIADRGGFHALPDAATVFDGAQNNPTVDGFPPPPYPGDANFKVRVETRVLGPRTRAVLVKVSWASGVGAIKLEQVFHAAE